MQEVHCLVCVVELMGLSGRRVLNEGQRQWVIDTDCIHSLSQLLQLPPIFLSIVSTCLSSNAAEMVPIVRR